MSDLSELQESVKLLSNVIDHLGDWRAFTSDRGTRNDLDRLTENVTKAALIIKNYVLLNEDDGK